MRTFERASSLLRRIVRQPLVMAQGITSAYGLVATFAAANILGQDEFVVFTILTLAQMIGLGLSHSLVGEPALVILRQEPTARPRLRHLAVCMLPVLGIILVISMLSASLSWHSALLVTGATALPIVHNWVRVRGMAVRRFGVILMGDLVRLVGVLAVATWFLVASHQPSGVELQSWFLLCALPALIVPLMVAEVRAPATTPYRRYAHLARWQLVEYSIAQVQTSGPLLLVAAQSANPLVGAFRLAQTLTGPANLLYSALATNFLAMTATSGTTDVGVIAAGKRAATRITGATVSFVLVAVLIAVVAPGLFPAVEASDLQIGVLCIGLWTCTSASAGIHAVVLRSLYLQRRVAALRGALTVVTWGGFALGYALGGVGGSMVGGFLVSALANPLLVNTTAAAEYRRHTTEPATG